jgi:hypothetical protein
MSNNATGPRTEAGKAQSSLNAVKHGLCSQRAVIPGEDPAEWEAFRDAIVRGYAPSGLLERELAERVALQMWRQRRVARYEAELITAIYDEPAAESQADPALARLERTRTLMKALDKIVRYESHIGRQLKEALTMLREGQAQRPAVRPEASTPQPAAPRAPEPPAPKGDSSFRRTDAVERGLRRAAASLPRPGVSFADFNIVPTAPATKT